MPSSETPHTLILFDIDGTLLNTNGAGIAALTQGFQQAFPEHAARIPPLDLAGATDHGLVINIFNHANIPHTDSNRERFYSAYLHHLEKNLPTFNGHLLPGIPSLLAALSPLPNATLGLLTGNLQRGAKLKITHFNIAQHFTFGSYGDDHHDRDQLGPIAIQRATSTTGKSFSPHNTYVLGDTPKDIRCARAANFKAIAVATGGIPQNELARHHPDSLFPDFTNTNAVLRSLGFPS